MGWPQIAKTKTPQTFGRPAAIDWVKILSQPQVRANRAKPIKEILAARCVVYLRAVHRLQDSRTADGVKKGHIRVVS
jgi:hypothetical protein